MSLATRLTRCPRPFEPSEAQEVLSHLPGLAPPLADLVAGAAGCSPFLKSLLLQEGPWLREAAEAPEAALAALHEDLRATPPEALGTALRQAKRRVALLIGLADLGGVWALEDVTGHLTDFADLACDLALRAALGAEIRRGKLPGMTADDLATGAGMTVFAMGKMGAHELNYSSDIDLICLFDEERFARDDFHEARASLVRATRRMSAMLNDRTAEGYVFRTDLRLRPDSGVTPVCMAMAAAETYYESLGRTWERAAWIKARPCAGDLAAGARFIETLRPFVWRRHLDFAAIEDAHNMRLAIREHKGLGGALTLEGHNMKLGRGGIREIEFFTQTRQLIAGGRDPDLRVRGTVAGLRRLAQKGWVPEEAAEALSDHYRFHREVEHRVQMLRDAQTHLLPGTPEEFDRLAAFMGRETGALRAEITERLLAVDDLIEGFFRQEAPGAASPAPAPAAEFDEEVIARWRGYPALRSERAQRIFNRLRPEILARLARAANPAEALLAFDGFLRGLPAGVQVFSLFESNPQLIELLADIVVTAPALGAYLSRNAGVFDAVIAGDFFAPWPGRATLERDLAALMQAETDYERALDQARRWHKEWHFRIGVHHLRGLSDAGAAAGQYADLAGAVIGAIWPLVVAQFSQKHGPPPGRGAVVLGMGSLGAGRLTAGSDLDLIVIYDAGDAEASEGRRPLAPRPYYARLTQALITALTAPMAEGRLYEVDMRLRPSGNQGPVATSWPAFQSYQQEEAWLWEHLALTRARVICGEAGLGRDVEAFRARLLAGGHSREEVIAAVAGMRARVAEAKPPEGPWDVKLGPGRLMEQELLAQAGNLLAGQGARDVDSGLEGAVATGWLEAADGAALRAAHTLCWQVQMAARLLGGGVLAPGRIGEAGAVFVLRETGEESMAALERRLAELCRAAAEAIDRALGPAEG
ncbi:MAG: bifunctional [glutamine synthetase] adenylyltransferase/[glutamine synthetase]-adenylyl-L-tyrosine phosphorylase [Roseovarius sp.]|nr:bifunctional [glutamine synthetase] adenylyltransferase/[glutamine synthetase]-adenylyl-L-tyrosine phosphorylase [Roseovarius sp.]